MISRSLCFSGMKCWSGSSWSRDWVRLLPVSVIGVRSYSSSRVWNNGREFWSRHWELNV